MIGSLVRFLYADNEDNCCVILRAYNSGEMQEYVDDLCEDQELFLVYDLKSREYFYALANELSFIY